MAVHNCVRHLDLLFLPLRSLHNRPGYSSLGQSINGFFVYPKTVKPKPRTEKRVPKTKRQERAPQSLLTPKHRSFYRQTGAPRSSRVSSRSCELVRTAYEQRTNSVRTTREQRTRTRTNNARTRTNNECELVRTTNNEPGISNGIGQSARFQHAFLV